MPTADATPVKFTWWFLATARTQSKRPETARTHAILTNALCRRRHFLSSDAKQLAKALIC
jgi:hypothetical protein